MLLHGLLVLTTFALQGCSSLGVRSPHDGTPLSGQIIKPSDSGTFPTVMLLHGCAGLRGQGESSLRAHANYLAEHGYASLILDSYGPRGMTGGMMCKKQRLHEARLFRTKDVFGAYRFLTEQSFVDENNIFVMGQSHGGSVALWAAAGSGEFGFEEDYQFRGVVAYYPSCAAIGLGMVTPALIFVAGQDDWVHPSACQMAQDRDYGAPIDMVFYKDAHHAFDMRVSLQEFRGRAIAGDAEARADSRQRMVEFLDSHLAE